MNSIVNNLIWKFTEKIGSQLVSFIISTILARILSPSDYGTLVLATGVIIIISVFVDSGLGTALIQKKDADDTDFSTIFYTNVALCLVVYSFMFILAPVVADYYSRPDLTPIIRVLSINIIIAGFTNIQNAYVAKNMIFKKSFYATLVGTIASGVLGIFMAMNGFGVWSLVAQQILYSLINTIMLWGIVGWKPKWIFSFSRLISLFRYSWKLLFSALLNTGYGQLRRFVIAKIYSTEDLAYYSKGENFPTMLVNNINASIDSVLLPSMSNVQDNLDALKFMMRKSIKSAVYVLSPMLFGLAAVADKVIVVLLTEKWVEAIPFLRIFCIIYLFYPIHTANLNAVKALGRSDIFLKLELLKKGIAILLMLTTMRISVWAMCLSTLASTIISLFINSWPNKKLLNYSIVEQFKDIAPYLIFSTFMAITVFIIGRVNIPILLSLVVQVAVGVVIYIVGSILFKFEEFDNLMSILKTYLDKIKK